MSLTDAEPESARGARPQDRIQVAVVGCGDVARRRYLPALSALADRVEVRVTNGTISLGGESSDEDGPASVFVDDDSSLGLEGWMHKLRPPPPPDTTGVVEAGLNHFVACLRGESTPILTAEYARHVLDIILKAYASIDDGRSHETETTFDRPAAG